MPIAEGPLKVLPSLRACCASSFASRSGTPSVIIETSWIFGSLSASIPAAQARSAPMYTRSEEHTSELQSRLHLVCRLLLEKKKTNQRSHRHKNYTYLHVKLQRR